MAPKKCRPSSRNSRESNEGHLRSSTPLVDKADWLLTQVVHDLTNQGYTNRLQLEVKLDELPE
ncbi:hypothetical protein FICEBENF_01723 [Aeromonas hydrophila]